LLIVFVVVEEWRILFYCFDCLCTGIVMRYIISLYMQKEEIEKENDERHCAFFSTDKISLILYIKKIYNDKIISTYRN